MAQDNSISVRTVAVSAVVAAVIGVASSAWANHQFPDVPTGDFFHGSIDEIAFAGCASGYPDGTFRPNQDITREQFAYWLANCGSRVRYDTLSTDFGVADGTPDDTDVLLMGVHTGGTTNGPELERQYVTVTAVVEVNTSGDQESTFTLEADDGSGFVTVDDTNVTVVTPTPSTTNPTDRVVLTHTAAYEVNSGPAFRVSGTRNSGVPLANVEMRMTAQVAPFPAAVPV